MILTTWNIRGFNDPNKVPVVKALLRNHSVNMLGLLETKVKAKNTLKIQKKFGLNWKWKTNDDFSNKGRIWVGWKDDDLDVQIILCHEQFIQCLVETKDRKHKIHVYVIYGLNTVQDRKIMWNSLSSAYDNNMPAIFAGDFNAVTSVEDRINGKQVAQHEIIDFLNFLANLNLISIDTKGPYFTWSNKGDGDLRVASRIDRSFVNEMWRDTFQLNDALVLPPNISDHSPLVVNCFSSNKGGGRPFRFLNCIAEHPDFLSKVSSAWNTPFSGCRMFQVWNKLKEVKKGIKLLHTHEFGNIQEKIDIAAETLNLVQTELADDISNAELQTQETKAITAYKHWLGIQESIYRQKSRIQWLQLGDSNNHFFFSSVKHRNSRNRIDILYNEQDELLSEPDHIASEISQFYKRLLGTRSPSLQGVDSHTVQKGPKLSIKSQDLLIAPVTQDQIEAAMKSIKDSKAPGLDGFNALFFKKTWPVIKDDVSAAIMDFFQGKPLLKQWNCTSITLIPKVESPSYVKEYRPIACCTVLYKIISKILTGRLAQVIGEVVDEAQAGFIPGKFIADNILLATELMKGYNHKYISPRCLVKVDLKKAYDSVEWSFIQTMLEELSFPQVFVKWVMECITSVSYSILLNGNPIKPVKAEKGVRQGDPMSPFIFAIAMEYLSRCLAELKQNPDFNYHPRCERLCITHLMFADDLLLLSRGDETSLNLIYQAFQKFSHASGLEANLSKSTVYFGGLKDHEMKELQQVLPIPEGALPFTYLGVPLSAKKLTINECKPLVEKVTMKIKSWTTRFLSYAGRLQLITCVLFGVQAYWAQIFVLPKKIIKEIEAKCRAFLWTGKGDQTRKALVAWERVCTPKKSGGLNVVDLGLWNKAATVKLLWNIANKTDSLWVKWIHTYYFKKKKLEDAKVPNRCSWNLKKVLKYRNIIEQAGGWGHFTPKGKYSIKAMYLHLKPNIEDVQWKRVIINNAASPKSLFITWLTLLNRLYTKDRMTRWNIPCDPTCNLCQQENESVQHLFFQCDYSNQVWTEILKLLKYNRSIRDWEQEVEWVGQQCRKTKAQGKVLAMCFSETIYNVWLQRNSDIFNSHKLPVKKLVRDIIFRVSCRCNSDMRNLLIM